MRKKTAIRTKFVTIRFTPEEFARLRSECRVTTMPGFTGYLRQLIFRRPITRTTRNRSLDDFMEEMILLRAALNRSENIFDEALKKLHVLDQPADVGNWLQRHDADRQAMVSNIVSIKDRINQISDQWLQ